MSGLAEEELGQSAARVWAKRIGVGLVVLTLVIGVAFLVKGLGSGVSKPKRQVAKIQILPDTPPPPPPKPKDEPKPEPKEQKETQVEQPKPQELPQEAQQLKMEGAAGDGPSAFAAGAVANEYKGGEIGSGTTGGSRVNYAFYTQVVQRHLQSQLHKSRKVKGTDYRVTVKVWLDAGGGVERAELVDSTGNADTDRMLHDALKSVTRVPQSPPENMPQPLRLRITNRIS